MKDVVQTIVNQFIHEHPDPADYVELKKKWVVNATEKVVD
jgi:hypothetical protein